MNGSTLLCYYLKATYVREICPAACEVVGGVVYRGCARDEMTRKTVRTAVLSIIGVLFFAVSGCGADEAKFPNGEAQPSAEPIEMLLKVSGSRGGTYNNVEWSVGEGGGEAAKTEEAGEIVGPEPAEHRFDLGSGVTENALGETVYKQVRVHATKSGQGSGKMSATLYANEEVVDCANNSRADGDSITLKWSTSEGRANIVKRTICWGYRFLG